MSNIQQLVKKNTLGNIYNNIFPKTFFDAITDKETGTSLKERLAMFNMLFLSYVGSKSLTRTQVPISFRREGLWVTYVMYDKTVVTEWYTGEAVDNTSWGNDSNWRNGSNSLVGDITISSTGYWVINGVISEIKAQGDAGITPILRIGDNNHLQVSYTNGATYIDVDSNPVFTQFRINNNKLQQSLDLGISWEDVSDYIASWFRWSEGTNSNLGKLQISRDNVIWTDLSPEFENRMHIKEFVSVLPATADYGDIYMVGPTYLPEDIANENPYYRMWVMQDTWVDAGDYNKNNYSYSYNVKKTYASVDDMNADVTSPIGTNGSAINIGDLVTVVNSTTPSENGFYSYEGSVNGWKLQSGFNFQVEQVLSDSLNTAPSSKLFKDITTTIAPEWVPNTPYAWYDFVMHNNLLYMCISTNSDATWIGDHWLVKNVGKVLTSHYRDDQDISSLLSDTAVALDTTVDNFAIPWISNHSYAVGEFVIREYKLYRCKTANNDSVWTASKWVTTSIEDELVQVRSDLNNSHDQIANLQSEKEDKTSKQIISDVEYEALVASDEILPDVLYYTYEA